jgi:hypothetical protein
VAEALGLFGSVGVGRVLIADFTQLADCLKALVVLLLSLHVGDELLTALVGEEPDTFGKSEEFFVVGHVCPRCRAKLGRSELTFLRRSAAGD